MAHIFQVQKEPIKIGDLVTFTFELVSITGRVVDILNDGSLSIDATSWVIPMPDRPASESLSPAPLPNVVS